MKLGILDFGEIPAGSNAISVIHQTIEAVQHCEKLGFDKYWLAEHFSEEVAWRKSELVLGLMAAYTEHIRVGSAGVSLPVANLAHVALNYKLMANLFPGRVDLGLAKGFAENTTALLVNEGDILQQNIQTHLDRCRQIMRYLHDEEPALITPPVHGEKPMLWMLGSTTKSKNFVIEHKTCFSLSIFHRNLTPELPQEFRDFQKAYEDAHGEKMICNLALTVMLQNDFSPLTKGVDVNIQGQAREICERLEETAEKFGVNELVVLPLCSSHDNRMTVIENISTLIPSNAYAKF